MSDLDLDSYLSSLKNIERKLKVFVDKINDILRDLEDNDPRKNYLEDRLLELSSEVIKNEVVDLTKDGLDPDVKSYLKLGPDFAESLNSPFIMQLK